MKCGYGNFKIGIVAVGPRCSPVIRKAAFYVGLACINTTGTVRCLPSMSTYAKDAAGRRKRLWLFNMKSKRAAHPIAESLFYMRKNPFRILF